MFMVFMIAPIVQMSNIGSQLTEAFARDWIAPKNC